MTWTQVLLKGLGVAAETIPVAGPAVHELLGILGAEEQLSKLDAALNAALGPLPSDAQLDAADAKILLEEIMSRARTPTP